MVRILLTLTLLVATVEAENQATLMLSPDLVSADVSTGTFDYPSFPKITVSGGLRLSAQVVFVPLSSDQHADDVTYQSTTDTLGVIPAGNLTDIPTSLEPERYDAIVTRAAVNRPGQSAVEVIDETTIAGERYARVLIFPVSVDANGLVSFNREVSVRVGGILLTSQQLLTAEAAASIATATPELTSGGSGPEYLIVTTSILTPAIQRLADFKIALGITTEVRLVDDMVAAQTGRDTAERLREALKAAYQSGTRYVLLAGDETLLPVRYAYPYTVTPPPTFDETPICDLYFADVNGDWNADNDDQWGERYFDQVDQTPELMVGRLPFSTLVEAENYVEKLIVYETDPGRGNRSYLENVMFFCSDQMRDTSYGLQHQYVAAGFSGELSVDTITGLEQSTGDDPSPTNLAAPEMVGVLDAGYGFVNVLAHGAAGQFAVKTAKYNTSPKSCIVTDSTIPGHGPITELMPNDYTGFWYSAACDNGAFDMDLPPYPYPSPSLVQTLLGLRRAGAVAMIAYSRYGWVALSYLQQRTFVDSLFAHPDRPAIEAFYAEKAVHASYRDLVYGQNFYGDPTLHIYTSAPQPLVTQTHLDGTDLMVRVVSAGTPVAGAKIIVSSNGICQGQYITGMSGEVNLAQSLTGASAFTIAAVKSGYSSNLLTYIPAIGTDVEGGEDNLPATFALSQNYPNPFNPSTSIHFSLPTAAHVRLIVYNVLGQALATLLDGEQRAGEHEVTWDGSTAASGVYYYRLEAGDFVQTKKMVLLR